MAIGIEGAFLVFGGIIIIGYIGELFSKKFSIPSTIMLLLIGYLLKVSGYVDVADLTGLQSLFGTLALIILLFDGGLTLNILDVLFKSGRIFLMSILITVASMFAAGFLMQGFGFDFLIGAIVGAIAGGIGSTTTISILKGLELPKDVGRFLTLESSITDIFSIILTIVLTQNLLSGFIDVQMIGQGILSTFSVGTLVGIVGGILFISIFSRIEKGYSYMVMLGVILILYALSEFFGGSGAIGVLIFSIMLGNENLVRKIIRIEEASERIFIREFHTEISFIIRTFFFVFLGIIVNFSNINNFIIALGLVISFLLIRYLITKFVTRSSELSPYSNIITVISPRGLATAVLATYPLTTVQSYLQKAQVTNGQDLISKLTNLPEIAFNIIILTIILTSILVPFVYKKQESKSEVKKQNKKK
ncbi:cation:proton antiporter [Candidatus Micrarchaeota archaeon]|nr:cation:proton antiporter [Candidatus Micrarchaeota archaeon]